MTLLKTSFLTISYLLLLTLVTACNPVIKIKTDQNITFTNSTITAASTQVINGGSVVVTLTLKNQKGKTLANINPSILFSISDGTSSGVFGAVNDIGNGVFTTTFTGTTPGTPVFIKANINGEDLTTTLPTIEVIAGTPASINIFSGDSQSASAGSPLASSLVAIVEDASGYPVAGVTVTWGVTGGGGTLFSCTTTTEASGQASCSLSVGTVIGANTVTATIAGPIPATFFTATSIAGAVSLSQSILENSTATTLVSGTTSTLTITLKDSYGNQITDNSLASDLAITMLTTGTSSGSVGTITPLVGNDGIYQAVLTATTAGTANTINASFRSANFTSTDPSLTVSFGSATKLAFVQQPTAAGSGSTINPFITVVVQDANNNTVTNYPTNIVISIDVANNPGSGTLSGTTSKPATNGIATYHNLAITNAGVGYNLRVTSASLSAALSEDFTVNPPAAGSIIASEVDTHSNQQASFYSISKVLDVSVTGAAAYPSTLGFLGIAKVATSATSTYGATSGGHTCSISYDGVLKCWGMNVIGQVGDGTTATRSTPVTIGAGYANVDLGDKYTCAITTTNELRCWGLNYQGQLGDGTVSPRLTPVVIGSGYASVSTGILHTCAITTTGILRCWGDNYHGQLGDGSGVDQHSPVTIGTGFSAVSTGLSHTCALKTSGELLCWGLNATGALGDSTTNNSAIPISVGTDFSSVTTSLETFSGYQSTCAIKTNRDLYCWGNNAQGQLGDGTGIQRLSPTLIGSDYIQVDSGQIGACGVKSNGDLNCWGSNFYGQLGDGTNTNRVGPTFIGTGYSSVKAGGQYTCAIATGGDLKCWGRNIDYAQLGDGSYSNRNTPPNNTNLGSCSVISFSSQVASANCSCNGVTCTMNYNLLVRTTGSATINYRVYDGTGNSSDTGILSITMDSRLGCTDPSYPNYDIYADIDDGGCEFP